ncbi:MAG: carbamate kinase [Bacteroidales bacterium]|jgi:carbamate kinase|nr:carbamate kinase [Bacteroidales bacterium]
MTKLAVIAFGGNALLRAGQKGTINEQIENVTETCQSLINLIKTGYNVVIGHGNGPQVGNVMLQHEAGKQIFDIERQPLDFCVSETQGSIGYLIEQGLRNVLTIEKINRNVVTLVTQVVVDKNDPMFANPTKPVGPYYQEEEAREMMTKTGAKFNPDPKGNGWRKVVPSPRPLKVENIELIKQLADAGHLIVTVGGGGIPIIENEDGTTQGVEAVIDKDLASALTAVNIKADEFYILTDVPKVYINFKKPDEQALDVITVAQAKQHLADGQFTEGSMAPKVRAAIYFVEHGGEECIITEASQLGNPTCGTRIIK